MNCICSTEAMPPKSLLQRCRCASASERQVRGLLVVSHKVVVGVVCDTTTFRRCQWGDANGEMPLAVGRHVSLTHVHYTIAVL